MSANSSSGMMSGDKSPKRTESDSSAGGPHPKQHQQQQLLFMMLIQQYQQIAQTGLGQLENASTGALEVDLSSARFAIDTLSMLKEFTKGNVTKEMSEYVDAILSPLRADLEAIE